MIPKHFNQEKETFLRIIHKTLDEIPLNLKGIRVLTEAANDVFSITPLLAALAGADHVYAVGRDSNYGKFDAVQERLQLLSQELGVAGKITVTNEDPSNFAELVDLVTNLKFVRPISSSIIEKLPQHAAIALMWAPWEFRKADIDLDSANRAGIPIIATNEDNPSVATFEYVGILALKLLLESGRAIYGENILIVGSDPFGQVCESILVKLGAKTFRIDPSQAVLHAPSKGIFRPDAVIVVEHRFKNEILGSSGNALLKEWQIYPTSVVHICGNIDSSYLRENNFTIYPRDTAPFGFMSVTTGYLGVEPVARLHAAGLHAGAIVVRARMKGKGIDESLRLSTLSGDGLELSEGYK